MTAHKKLMTNRLSYYGKKLRCYEGLTFVCYYIGNDYYESKVKVYVNLETKTISLDGKFNKDDLLLLAEILEERTK